jgi:hypothetical protein
MSRADKWGTPGRGRAQPGQLVYDTCCCRSAIRRRMRSHWGSKETTEKVRVGLIGIRTASARIDWWCFAAQARNIPRSSHPSTCSGHWWDVLRNSGHQQHSTPRRVHVLLLAVSPRLVCLWFPVEKSTAYFVVDLSMPTRVSLSNQENHWILALHHSMRNPVFPSR